MPGPSLISQGLSNLKDHWKEDLKAGFGVSLIALPLSLGIAMASGFPPIAGLFAAIIGGLLVSRINGSHVTITGPAAGLIVVNLAAIESLGQGDNDAGYRYALAAIVVGGIIITLFGIFKAGKFGDFFPTSAVHGMLAAIGVIIMVKQFYVAVGVHAAHGHEFYESIFEMPFALRHANPEVALIALVSLLILAGYPYINNHWIKMIPSPIWVLAVAIPMEFLMDWEHAHEVVFLGEHFKVGPQLLVHLPDKILDGVVFPDFGKILTGAFWIAVTGIALVTAIESLLSALAVDSLDPFHRKSNLNRDLGAVGAGSTVSGLIGGLPMISEIVRSSANVTNGGKTQWANFFHAFLLLIFILFLRPIIGHIPIAALAAMLIYTGYHLASPIEFKHVYQIGKSELLVFLITLVMVLVTDLLIGIAFGILVNMVLNVIKGTSFKDLFIAHYSIDEREDEVRISMKGAFVFSNFLGLKKAFSKYSKKNIHLELSGVSMVDHTVVHHLGELERTQELKGLTLEIENTGHLNPVSEHPLAERRSNAKVHVVKESKRDRLLKEYTLKHGWAYNPGSQRPRRWKTYPSFREKLVRHENNIITANILGTETTIADVLVKSGAMFTGNIDEFTALHIPLNGVPEFTLEKENIIHRLMEGTGIQDIDFDTHPQFSQHYLLHGSNEDAIRMFFNDDLLTYLEGHDGFHVEGNHTGMIVYTQNKQLNPKEIHDLVDFVEGFVQKISK
jgi:MFS superfamily sulfate permease-like transporter